MEGYDTFGKGVLEEHWAGLMRTNNEARQNAFRVVCDQLEINITVRKLMPALRQLKTKHAKAIIKGDNGKKIVVARRVRRIKI